MSGIALDDRSFERMRRAVRWVEDQAGETAPPANQGGGGGAGRWFRTQATEPASYDGTKGFPGHLVEMDSEGAEFRLSPGKVYDPNESRLAADTLYRVVYRGSENNEPVFWVTSGAAAQADEVKTETVIPWRIMTVYRDDEQGRPTPWTVQVIFVKSYRYFHGWSYVDPSNQYAPDLNKIPLPGDPILFDENFWGGGDPDLSLYMTAQSVEGYTWPFPDFGGPLSGLFSTHNFPEYAALAWYNAFSTASVVGQACVTTKFAKSKKYYVLGYQNERHYIYNNFWDTSLEIGPFYSKHFMRTNAYPYVTKVRYGGNHLSLPYADTVRQYNYISQRYGTTFFKLRFYDPYGLLEKNTAKEQLVLVQPVCNGMPRVYWYITQIYHPKSPGDLALIPYEGPIPNLGSFGSTALAQSTTSQDSFLIPDAPLDSLFELTRPTARRPGGNVPGGGGGFETKTAGEE